MKKCFIYFSTILFGFFCCFSLFGCKERNINTSPNITPTHGQFSNTASAQSPINLSEIPLYFIANEGQVNEQTRFYAMRW